MIKKKLTFGEITPKICLAILLVISGTLVMASDASDASIAGGGGILTVKETDETMTIDGLATEAAWNSANQFSFEAMEGVQANTTTAIMKALFDTNNVYLLFIWTDASATESVWESGWVYSSGSFAHIANANPSIYESAEEDRLALIWDINTFGFEDDTCYALCHEWPSSTNETAGHDEKSGMYTDGEGERADEWHWKAARSNPLGIAHDKYIHYVDADGTAAADWDSEGGHSGDGESWYSKNINATENGPKYFEPNATGEDAKSILQSEIDSGEAILVAGNESQLTSGQKIPGRILDEAVAVGDVADVKAKGTFSGGVWTLEMKRALDTASEFDTTFDLEKTNYFGIAVFDDGGHFPQHAQNARNGLRFEGHYVDTEESSTDYLVILLGLGVLALLVKPRIRRSNIES
ncbi:MAG: ethylbenzene dehydrogenase-related protein [Candidatus Heimdallarchaeota archaeon]